MLDELDGGADEPEFNIMERMPGHAATGREAAVLEMQGLIEILRDAVKGTAWIDYEPDKGYALRVEC